MARFGHQSMDSGKVLLLVKHFGMASTVFVCATVKIPGHTLAGPLVGIAPKFKKSQVALERQRLLELESKRTRREALDKAIKRQKKESVS